MFDSLSARLQDVFKTLRGEARLTPENIEVALREIRLALLEADVNVRVVKSFIARVTKNGASYKVLGVVLNDGSPLKSVEVKVDEGQWQPATFDPSTKEKFGWKLFTYTWNGAAPGEHTLVSRVTEMNGKVQPTPAELETKKSFLEENSQVTRKVTIA